MYYTCKTNFTCSLYNENFLLQINTCNILNLKKLTTLFLYG